MLLNYVMKNGDKDFSSFIMNGPFLDWGAAFNDLGEHAVEKLSAPLLKFAEHFGFENPVFSEGKGISTFGLKLWLLYRWSLNSRPLEANSVTVGWAAAVSKVQKELKLLSKERESGLTTKPTFVVSSKADAVLEHDESIAHSTWVNKACVIKELQHQSHDVTLSLTKDLTDEALQIIKVFLKEA